MPVQSTENPQEFLRRDLFGAWTATRSWMVTGTSNRSQVLSATPLDGSPIVQLGNSHPLNTLLTVTSQDINQEDAFKWTVVANYTVTLDKLSENTDPSLLTQAARVSWSKGNYSLPADRDKAGIAIVNSAGFAFDPAQQISLRTRHLRIIRYEPFFDLAKSAAFEDRTNSNTFIVGPMQIGVGECICEAIEPAEEFSIDAQVVPIAYDFEIRRLVINNTRIPPFRLYVKDQGTRGWWSDNGTKRSGEFINADGTQVTQPVALDGTGLPLDTTIKVLGTGDSKNTPVTPASIPTSAKVAALSNSFITTLGFDLFLTADFSQMGL